MKDLSNFLSEGKKESGRPESKGKDDKKYVRLMEEYKRARRGDREKANEILEQAKKLKREGDVSKNAILAGAHI